MWQKVGLSMFLIENLFYQDILEIDSALFNQGQLTYIWGESGSGKTTLLKHFNRMLSPDAGTVYYRGEDISKLDPIHLRRQVSMLPQKPLIFQGDIPYNLAVGAIFSGKPYPDKEKISKALDIVELKVSLESSPSVLSGGELQRLSLARLIIADPEVFLLDEPSSSLDKGNERAVMKSLTAYLKDQKKTAIIISHSEDIAAEFSDRIVRLIDGKIIE